MNIIKKEKLRKVKKIKWASLFRMPNRSFNLLHNSLTYKQTLEPYYYHPNFLNPDEEYLHLQNVIESFDGREFGGVWKSWL